MGIIGMGTIGRAVAKRAAAFNLEIKYHNRKRMNEEDEVLLNGSARAEYMELDALLKTSDFIVLACPLTLETRHLIAASASTDEGRCCDCQYRKGPVINTEDLIAALSQRPD